MPSPAASHVVLESFLSCIMLGLVMYPCAEPGLAVQTSEFMHLFNYTAVYDIWLGGACPVLLWMVCLRTVSFLMFSLRLFEDREGAELCCIILLQSSLQSRLRDGSSWIVIKTSEPGWLFEGPDVLLRTVDSSALSSFNGKGYFGENPSYFL